MEFVNNTAFPAGWTVGFQPDGREILVIAVKATYSIPQDGGDVSCSELQLPLTEADEFTGEPGLSATLHESDYAHRKPLCDVLVNGSAYAPGGRPTTSVTVGLHVGPVSKRFNVVGDRQLIDTFLMVAPCPPTPFVTMPISYDHAYGGSDKSPKKPDHVFTYVKNPIGVGYYPASDRRALAGKPLPNTEEIGIPITSVSGDYTPMSFGPIGRNFAERISYAGTYNEEWLKTCAPFFPEDFDYRYFQAASADQQIPYPRGGEEVVLENLTPEGRNAFRFPSLSMPILFLPFTGQDQEIEAAIDTILIEPDQNRFALTWRATLPLRQNCFEIRQTIVGEALQAWRRSERTRNKPHYANLAEYAKARRTGRQP